MTENSDLFRALSDLREVRRAIDRVGDSAIKPTIGSLQAHIVIHYICIAFFVVLLVADVGHAPSLTSFLYATHYVEGFRYVTVFVILAILLVLCCTAYLLVWRAARRASEEMAVYIARNFRYLSVASFASDTFLKFSAVALVILARRPDWVSAVLLACAGDALIQGRGFVLPVRVSLLLGISFLLAATVVLIWFDGFLWLSFVPILVALFLSVFNLHALRRAAQRETE